MKALLLIAHGSRSEKSNEEVRNITEKLQEYCKGEYDLIYPAFLELAIPLIPDGIRSCVVNGATSITILPYFLNSGRHVLEDIPNIVNEIKLQHKDIPITLASHLGASEGMMDILISTAREAA